MAQTILIVDDDPVQRRLLDAAISRSGMTVVTAPGGGPALDLVTGPRGDQISLMLLDLVMPDMDGLEVLAKLRKTHPDLVDWEELAEAEKEKDRNMVRNIPVFLAQAGFQVERLKSERAKSLTI